MRHRVELTLYTEVDKKTHRMILVSNDMNCIGTAVAILNYTNGKRIYDERYTLLIGLREVYSGVRDT